MECQDQESLFKMEVDLLVPANVQAGGSLFRDAAKSSNIWPGFLVIFSLTDTYSALTMQTARMQEQVASAIETEARHTRNDLPVPLGCFVVRTFSKSMLVAMELCPSRSWKCYRRLSGVRLGLVQQDLA